MDYSGKDYTGMDYTGIGLYRCGKVHAFMRIPLYVYNTMDPEMEKTRNRLYLYYPVSFVVVLTNLCSVPKL